MIRRYGGCFPEIGLRGCGATNLDVAPVGLAAYEAMYGYPLASRTDTLPPYPPTVIYGWKQVKQSCVAMIEELQLQEVGCTLE